MFKNVRAYVQALDTKYADNIDMEKIMSKVKEFQISFDATDVDSYVNETAQKLRERVLEDSGLDMKLSILKNLIKKRELLYLKSGIDAEIEIFATDSRNPNIPDGLALVWEKDGKEEYEVYYA